MDTSEQENMDFFSVEIYSQVDKTEGDVKDVRKCSINTTVQNLAHSRITRHEKSHLSLLIKS